MPDREYLVIDAFADGPFTGNPAGVVMDASRLDERQMQAIAREIHLNETAFILPATRPNAAVRLRTFTPTDEQRPSGHSTIAAVAAMIRVGRFKALIDEPGLQLPIETSTGLVTARAERIRRDGDEFLVWIHVPQPRLTRLHHDPIKTAGLLGLDPQTINGAMPAMSTGDGDVILPCGNYGALMEARPDFAALAEFSRRRRLRTWCLATLETLSPTIDVHSRCFAPILGLNEDPVTACVHAALAVYLVVAGEIAMAGDRAGISSIQSDFTGRAGLVRALVVRRPPKGYDAWIGGQCLISMTGRVRIPS